MDETMRLKPAPWSYLNCLCLGAHGAAVVKRLAGLLLGVCIFAGPANAQVIVPGTDPDHLAAAIGRDYSAAFFLQGDRSHNAGTLTLIDLPWTNEPWVIGPKHALDYTGQLVNEDYEVVFGQSPVNAPGEVIGLSDFRLKGLGGLFSVDDVFLAKLDHHPAGIDPIPLYLEDLSAGMEGSFTGSGDLYDGWGTFLGYDGDVRNGGFKIKEIDSFHIQSRLYQPGHSQYDPFKMGGAPGFSGSPVEMLMSSGEFGMAAMANYVEGGFSYLSDTVALRVDEIYPWIYAETIPEPATLSLLLVGSVFVIRRRCA